MAQIVNTFVGGMDKDTNPNSYSNKTYYHAENLRLIVDEDLSSATLTSINQHQVRLYWDRFSRGDTKLCGFTATEDYGIFFIKYIRTNQGDTYGGIYLVNLSNLSSNLNIIYNNEVAIVKNDFAFSDRVEVIAREESDSVLKIYWVDGTNPMRFCNILAGDTTYWEGIETDKFNIVQDMEFGTISIDSIVYGSLKTGTHQYSYCYYNLEGAESAYSTFTHPVSLSDSSIPSTRTQEHKGSKSGENSGKGIVLTLSDLDTNFDRIRIVRAYKATQETVPEISIVYEGALTTTFTDTGGIMLGTLIAEEVVAQPNIFSAATLETKNNYLFVGNLTDIPVDMDWLDTYDTRVFRFKGGDATCKTLKDSLSTTVNTFTGLTEIPDLEDDLNTPIINNLSYDGTIPEEDYKYQINSSVIGGTGNKVSFEFITDTYSIDDGTNLFGRNNSSKLYIDSFEKVGYNRDEIYRFGIVFYDEKGRHSFVKWIGDIRFPRLEEVPITSTYNVYTGATTINVLGISFTIDTTDIPSTIKSFQIVRAIRDFNNSTVVDAGYISYIAKAASNNKSYFTFTPSANTSSPPYETVSTYRVLEYINGEIVYNGNNNITTNRLDTFNAYAGYNRKRSYAGSSSYSNNVVTSKLTPATSGTTIRYTGVRSQKLTATRNLDKTTNVFGKNIVQRNASNSVHKLGKGSKGTTLMLELDTAFVTSLYMVYAYRRRFISPYGGTSVQALSTTTYIPCSPITEISGASVSVDVYGGDTYISTCEIQRLLWNDIGEDVDNKKYANCVLGIVESKLNYNFISNPTWSSLDNGAQLSSGTGITEDGSFYHAIWEKAGSHPIATIEGVDEYFVQDFDLYTYNPVYSPINNTKTFIPEPLDENFVENFPASGYRSERKFDGEQIDYWTKFLVNNRFDLPSKYGEITKFIEHNDRLVSFQPKGIAYIPVEEREAVQTQNTSTLGVGTGGVAERFDYITTKSGSALPYSVLSTMNALYYIDGENKKIGKIAEGLEFISDTKGMFSHLSAADLSVAYTTYNPKLKEIFFDFDDERLVYNEYTQNFISFYKATYHKDYFYSLLYGGEINYIGMYGTYNESEAYLIPKLELIVNPSNNKVCRYDSIALTSYSSSGFPLDGFQCITQENQDTGALGNSNFKERQRVYRCNTLRDASNNRLVSHYMKEKFIFLPIDLKVYDITTSFAPLNNR